MKNLRKYTYIHDSHLNEEEIAIYIDAYRTGRIDSLPDEMIKHIELCKDCRIQILEAESLLQKISAERMDMHSGPQKRKIRKYIAIAASLLFLLAISLVLMLVSVKTNDPEKLFTHYFSPYPDVVTTKNINQDPNEKMFYLGLQQYTSGNMDSAIRFFQAVEKDYPKFVFSRFYLAICLLSANKDIDVAISYLKWTAGDSRLQDQSYWYLSLAYVKTRDYENATACLDSLIHGDSYFRGKANGLRRKLRNF